MEGRTHGTGTSSAQVGVHDSHAASRTLMEQATSVPVNTPQSAQEPTKPQYTIHILVS